MGYFNYKTALMRCYDANNTLLYVGISANPYEQPKVLSAKYDWMHLCTRIDLEWFDKRSLAERELRTVKAACAPAQTHNVALS